MGTRLSNSIVCHRVHPPVPTTLNCAMAPAPFIGHPPPRVQGRGSPHGCGERNYALVTSSEPFCIVVLPWLRHVHITTMLACELYGASRPEVRPGLTGETRRQATTIGRSQHKLGIMMANAGGWMHRSLPNEAGWQGTFSGWGYASKSVELLNCRLANRVISRQPRVARRRQLPTLLQGRRIRVRTLVHSTCVDAA